MNPGRPRALSGKVSSTRSHSLKDSEATKGVANRYHTGEPLAG